MASESISGIVASFQRKYESTTPRRVKLIDRFLVAVLFTGIFQAVYCLMVGTFPFNAFLSGFMTTIGVFVLTVGLRMQVSPGSEFTKTRTTERAFADYIGSCLLLFLVAINFMG